MSTTSWLAFGSFFSRLPQEKKERLSHFISSPLLEKVESLPPTFGDLTYGVENNQELLGSVHYTWILSLFESFSEQDQLLFLSVLKKSQREKIGMQLTIGEELPPVSSSGREFMTNYLTHWLITGKKDFLPKPLLPDDPLNALLDFSKEELIKLFDFLGLYDLSFELKKIIESSKLKAIQEILSPEEILFLKRIQNEKDRLSTPPLGIAYWDGEEKKLRNMLQSRGINRLAKALFFSSEALKLYLEMKLDISRAKVLKKYSVETHDEEARKILINQVLTLIREFKAPK